MAKWIQAVKAFAPRLKLGHTFKTPEVTEMIARRTSLNAGEIRNVLCELNATILFCARMGSPVKLDELGTFTPTMALDGSLHIVFRPDVNLERGFNHPDAFNGEVHNRENIGKTSEELKTLWNDAHPNDKIT
jgi:hypothetical protein